MEKFTAHPASLGDHREDALLPRLYKGDISVMFLLFVITVSVASTHRQSRHWPRKFSMR
jgi:hypothetical protein